jgi:hypothetical protein
MDTPASLSVDSACACDHASQLRCSRKAVGILKLVRTLYRSRSILVLALGLAFVLSLPAPALATRTLGLSSGTFKFDVGAGQTASGTVIVINSGDEPLKVMVYVSDQTVDDKGNVTYIAPTRADLTSLANPSSWTRVTMPANSKALGNIPYIELKPGERVPVRFTVEVPPNVPPGDHNVLLFFESFELPTGESAAMTQVSGRIGSRVTLRVEGTLVEKLELRPFNVPAFVLGSEVPYQFVVRNIGNVDQRIGARVMLLDRGDNAVQQLTAINGVTVFAGTNREASGTLVAQKMPLGPFKVRVDVTPVDDNGKAVNAGADTITEVRDVWLVPMWLIFLLGALVVVAIISIVWALAARFTRRADARKSERDGAPAEPAAPVAPADEASTFYDPEKGE